MTRNQNIKIALGIDLLVHSNKALSDINQGMILYTAIMALRYKVLNKSQIGRLLETCL